MKRETHPPTIPAAAAIFVCLVIMAFLTVVVDIEHNCEKRVEKHCTDDDISFANCEFILDGCRSYKRWGSP